MNYAAALVMVAALVATVITVIAWTVGLWSAVPSIAILAGVFGVGYAASRFIE